MDANALLVANVLQTTVALQMDYVVLQLMDQELIVLSVLIALAQFARLIYVFLIALPWEMETMSMDACAQLMVIALLQIAQLMFANHLQIKLGHTVL